MPVFEYRGLNKQGKNIKGVLDAESVRNARVKLKRDGIFVVDIKDKTKRTKSAKGKNKALNQTVNVSDLSMMTRQLATLLKSNIPLVESLAAVAEQVENPVLSESLSEIKNMVNEGSSLYRALEKYPKIYNRTFISMCEAGETSGTLDVILIRLAEFTEARNELESKVKSAMLYPVIMLVFTMGMLAVMFVYVVPKMMTIFESVPELELPWYTQMVISFSGVLVNYWLFLILAFVGSFALFQMWKNSPGGRGQWDAIVLKIPVVGKLARLIAVSRFTRTLSTLLTGGVPMLNALQIVRNVVDNEVLARAIEDARDNISEGESIAGPLKKSGQFPPIVIHMINIGEKTGELENMLSQVSDAYDFQVKTSITGLTSLLEPVMIVVMGSLIGTIVFSMMIPMFDMMSMTG